MEQEKDSVKSISKECSGCGKPYISYQINDNLIDMCPYCNKYNINGKK